jgi:phenylacetaldehyde dehydrogenase
MIQPFDGHRILPETRSFLDAPHRLLIDGQWVGAPDSIVARDPATGLELASVAIGGAREIDLAVAPGARSTADGDARAHRNARLC